MSRDSEGGGAETSAYKPYTSARRPGGRPNYKPAFRVLVHKKHLERWEELIERIGLDQAQRFYDHVAQRPGEPPQGIRATVLRGSVGRPQEAGFSKTVHWRVPGSAARLDYQYCASYAGGRERDAHGVVRVIAIAFGSH